MIGLGPSLPQRGVQFTRELQRVIALPAREWTEESAQATADQLTSILRRPGGSMSFRPIQGQALVEAGTLGGLFAPIRVGGGKTLLTLIAPFLLESRRPLLILPAKLVEKTKREMRELAVHWPIPNFIRIVSYELLGRVQSAEMLERYKPDLIVADEAHKLKNPKAAVTKRVSRQMKAHPETRFVAASGTMTKRSLKDFAHILQWCLGLTNAPVPANWSELDDWANALDEKTNDGPRLQLGALVYLCTTEERTERDQLTACRRAFSRRLMQTPGVVGTREAYVGCSLTLAAKDVDVTREMSEVFEILRTEWTTPDGWPISDPLTLWRHARELALGFYYRWDPRPPDAWLDARKTWAKACRELLANNRRNLDSEKQVTTAVDKGHYPEAWPLLERWREVKHTFIPHTVPVWFDDSVIKSAADWALEAPGIIWTEHTAVAERLASLSRLSYYGRRGEDGTGRFIEAHDPKQSLIASVASNAEGRNLQAWNRNLVISCPPNGIQWEQLIGRTHRDGQLADEVTFDIIITSLEHVSAFYQAQADAKYQELITRQAQKLLYADVLFPSWDDVFARGGYRWRK